MHQPSPISTTPAFSPGPGTTRGPVGGPFLRWTREDLYEQCSDHITLKTPSFGEGGLASAQQLFNFFKFIGREAVLPDELWGESHGCGRIHRGRSIVAQGVMD